MTLVNFHRIDNGFPDKARLKFKIGLDSLVEKVVQTKANLDAATETATSALLVSTLVRLITQGSLA